MKHTTLTPKLHDYLIDMSLRENEVLLKLRQHTDSHPLANMQVAPEQAQFLQFLIKSIGAKNILELGTFTGYSTLAMALALPPEGKIITCDINHEWTKDNHLFWDEAQQSAKIELKIAPALDSLAELLKNRYHNKFDFIFIDADKTNYVKYYEYALELISNNGIIAIDNIFWDGYVIDETDTSAQTREIRKLNNIIKNDQRVDISLLPIADGLFIIRKTNAALMTRS
jgi:predicted O-methyltransferase YrrM